MITLEKKSYIFTVLSFIVGALGLLLAAAAYDASWKIAESSGSLDKASLEIGIGGFPLAAAKRNFVVMGAPSLSDDKAVVIGVIPFTFRSSGKKSLESLNVSFQYHGVFQRDVLENGEHALKGEFIVTDLKKATSAETNRFVVAYSTALLNPGILFEVDEPVFIKETYHTGSVPFTSKDGVPMSVTYRAGYSKTFGMMVSVKDAQVAGYSIGVAMQRAKSIKDLTSGHLPAHISQRQKDIRKELGWWSYLVALITSSPTEDVFLVFVPLKKNVAEDAVVMSPAVAPQVATYTFPLITWRSLINK